VRTALGVSHEEALQLAGSVREKLGLRANETIREAGRAIEAAEKAGGLKHLPDTAAQFHSRAGWAPERAALHKEYAAKVVENVPRTSEPTVYMTGGGPASGKTTGLLENPGAGIPGKGKAAHIDADGAKADLPEYRRGVAAGDRGAAAHVHEESSYMAKTAIRNALESGHDVVFDSVGDNGIRKLEEKVNDMRAAGAKRIVANYATTDVDEAIRRSDARAEQTGRFVPHDVITYAHADVVHTLNAAIARGTFDELKVWDTSTRTPKLIAEYTKEGGLQVRDQAAWKAHLARGVYR
ncbi:MAG TPA: zeta toxin family protein, partial [Kofleriaceae bacterium]|nr:zeta toxin family protein [Kofleriaceae bacterium]